MPDRPEDEAAKPPLLSEAELRAFQDTANEFIRVANDLVGIEEVAEIAAAFLYACARYNSFAMQAMAEDPGAIDAETVDYLAQEFEKHLREHMAQQVCPDPGEADNPIDPPRRVVDLLKALNGREEDERSEFLDLGDRFINVANRLIQTERVGRISAAFMHACTRFNVFAMQWLGHAPGETDDALVAAFREAYVNLVNYHLQETLVAPRA